VGELLDAAFCVYRRQFARLALVAILISVPTVVVAAIYSHDAADALRDFTASMEGAARADPNDPWKAFSRMWDGYGRIIPTSLIAAGLQAFARAAAALAMTPVALAALRREAPPSLGAIAALTARRIVPAFVLQVAFDLSWSALVCCCPPLFLYSAVVLAPGAAILAAECGAMETWLRAQGPPLAVAPFVPFAACCDVLVRGARLSWNGAIFARAIGFFTVLLLFVVIFTSAVTMPVANATKDSGHWFWVQHCAEMMLLPVVGLGRALWYFDLVARREGADLEPAA